jgi:hypothetical protein
MNTPFCPCGKPLKSTGPLCEDCAAESTLRGDMQRDAIAELLSLPAPATARPEVSAGEWFTVSDLTKATGLDRLQVYHRWRKAGWPKPTARAKQHGEWLLSRAEYERFIEHYGRKAA